MLIKLPNSVISIADLEQLLETLESKPKKWPPLVQDLLDSNPRLDSRQVSEEIVVDYLRTMLDHPKIMTFSFAQKPSSQFLTELVVWVRTNIDEQIILNIQLDSMLVGGFVLRSAQKIYDFSWSSKLTDSYTALERLMSNVG